MFWIWYLDNLIVTLLPKGWILADINYARLTSRWKCTMNKVMRLLVHLYNASYFCTCADKMPRNSRILRCVTFIVVLARNRYYVEKNINDYNDTEKKNSYIWRERQQNRHQYQRHNHTYHSPPVCRQEEFCLLYKC